MNKPFIPYFVIGAAIALTACSSDDAPRRTQSGVPVSGDPIKLTTNMSAITEGSFNTKSRAGYDDPKYGEWVGEFTNTGTRNPLERFTCYAFLGNQKFMDNVKVNRNQSNNVCTWSADTWYWPMEGNLDFYAFAPHNYRIGDTYGDPNASGQQSDYHVTQSGNSITLQNFEVNNPPVADVIYAMARGQNRWTNNGNVDLRFQHALCAVEVYMENRHKYCDVAFHGADLLGLRYKATYNFPASGTTQDSDQRGWWSEYDNGLKRFNTSWLGTGYTEVTDVDPQMHYAIARHNKQDGRVKIFGDDHAVFLLPQPLARWNHGDKCNANDFRDGSGRDIVLDATSSGYKPCLVLRGYVKDSRNGVYLYNNQTGAGHDIVIPLNPNSNGDTFNWEPGKRYKYIIVFGDPDGFKDDGQTNPDHTMGWTDQQDHVAMSISVNVSVTNWNNENHWMWSDTGYRP